MILAMGDHRDPWSSDLSHGLSMILIQLLVQVRYVHVTADLSHSVTTRRKRRASGLSISTHEFTEDGSASRTPVLPGPPRAQA